MMEKNRSTLRKALAQLPDYHPPADLWTKLHARLEQNQDTLAEGLNHLPAYSPPPEVWNTISTQLESSTPLVKTRRWGVRHWMSLAAGVLLLLLAAFGLQQDAAPKVAMSYSQEVITPVSISMDWEEEEPQFDQLIQQLEHLESPSPSLNKLRLELEELNSAKKEVKVMLMAYGGRDPDLINQLGHIERERSAVYRALIKHI